jgi:hypothetical protein
MTKEGIEMITKQVGFRQVLLIAVGAVILSLLFSAALVLVSRKESQTLIQKKTDQLQEKLDQLGVKTQPSPKERPIIITGGSINVSTSNEYEESTVVGSDRQTLKYAKLVTMTVYNEDYDRSWIFKNLEPDTTSIDIIPEGGGGSIKIENYRNLSVYVVRMTFFPGVKPFRKLPWDDGNGRHRKRKSFKIKSLTVKEGAKDVPCIDESGSATSNCSGDYYFGEGKIIINIDTKYQY